MAKPKIYIDGKEGTTGLQIYDRLAKREDIELLLIDEAKRKDTEEKKADSCGGYRIPVPAGCGSG